MRSVWLRGATSVALLAYLVSQIDIRAAGEALVSVDLRYLLIVLVLVGIDRAGMVMRWVLLVRSSHQPVATKSVAWIHLVSSFVGSILPAGVGGDAARAYTLSRLTAQGSEAVASVAVDRLVGIVSIATMGAIGLAVWALRGPSVSGSVVVLVALSTVALGIITLWSDHVVRGKMPSSWQTSGAGRRLLRVSDAVARYRARPSTLAMVFLVSLCVQALRIVEAYLLGRGLGIDVELGYYLVFMPVGLLALLLPISIGGFGLPQGVIVWLLRPMGVPDPLSLALSTLIVVTGLVGTLPGALLYTRSRKK